MNIIPHSFTLTLLTALLGVCTAAEPSEDELLFFGTGVETPFVQKAPTPLPATTPPATPSAEAPPVKLRTAALSLLLLDAPTRSVAIARPASLEARAEQSGKNSAPVLTFSKGNQEMETALQCGIAGLRSQIPTFPAGLTVQYDLVGDYAKHEHDCAALACTVLLHSLVTGKELNPKIILCGGVGKDATITPAHALGLRLRTLPDTGSVIIGVAMESEADARDLALMGEPETLLRCEIIGLGNLTDALGLAAKEPADHFAKAHELFESVRIACGNTPLATFLKNPKVQQRLTEILQIAPQHLSARLLLQTALGKLPGRMTYLTSQQALLSATQPFVKALRSHDNPAIRKTATAGGNALSLMQTRIHPSVERYLLATRIFMRSVNNLLELDPSPQFNVMRQKAQTECNKLENDMRVEKSKLEPKK